MKIHFSLLLSIIIISSCSTQEQPTNSANSAVETNIQTPKSDPVKPALDFINGYVANANKMGQAVDMLEWVNASEFASKNFKSALKKIIDEAFELDPEMGLDADPIFNAQDYPSEGFEIESFDEKTNYAIVKGKDMPEFKLTLKMIEENGTWLVDGCGSVNVPVEKRK